MNAVYDFVMAGRFYLGAVPRMEGALFFTLVVESPTNFYVEAYNDSRLPFIKERTKIIRPPDFGNYEVNDVRLDKLVAEKFYEENFLVPEKKVKTSGR